MKIIKYTMSENGSSVSMTWSEANEELAKREAFGGEYVIEDDGQEEIVQPTTEERLAALESAMLEMLLGGAAE